MTEEETKRHEQIAQLAERSMDFARHQLDMEDAQNLLLRRLRDDDKLMIDGEDGITGYDARRLARQPRRKRVDDHIAGEFLIQAVESGQIERGFRARIRDENSKKALTISIPEGTLPNDQIEELKQGEWTKTPLYMAINVQRIGNRIIEANLTEVSTRPY